LDRYLETSGHRDLGSAREILDRIQVVEAPSPDVAVEFRYEIRWYSSHRERRRAAVARQVFHQLVRDTAPGLPGEWLGGLGD
jgi:hypothetical protein